MTRLKYSDNKLGRMRKGVNPLYTGPGWNLTRGEKKSKVKTIIAKYRGTCMECDQPYNKGDAIKWQPVEESTNSKTWHSTCFNKMERAKIKARQRHQKKTQRKN